MKALYAARSYWPASVLDFVATGVTTDPVDDVVTTASFLVLGGKPDRPVFPTTTAEDDNPESLFRFGHGFSPGRHG